VRMARIFNPRTNKSAPKVKAEEALTTLNLGHKSPYTH